MQPDIRILSPGKNNTLTDENGKEVALPAGWDFLPSGDAAITRKVTAMGSYWRVQERKGRKVFSHGLWAPSENINIAKKQTTLQRQDPLYQRKLDQSRIRREKQQEIYSQEFKAEIRHFLNFHPKHKELEEKVAILITEHAIPVGSGTVARTKMIPIQQRASKAVIAWMRHQTTAYDNMIIARIKGERRRVRQKLAIDSLMLLENYRKGGEITPNCPILRAMKQ